MKIIPILALALIPASSFAQSHCGGQTQLAINFCAKEKWAIADSELNRLWKDIKPAADARGEGQALLDEQRAWLRNRDATCDPELTAGGSADAMFYWACMEEQTLERNRDLTDWR
ncbi:lysozyme inhibitor LprI family protein [Ruegeria sp.]|uniref:lysozyme inhibitor LprI family protein n=1 Tax=Ruegeria sp. TaxID=1879320 RepID=UPI00232086C7|nr:lysozyme inhibitor LprI family protein [Ruegeria sp.]MDA7963435.1 DUF1311 domain-containing protein [Ruegeria sp.]